MTVNTPRKQENRQFENDRQLYLYHEARTKWRGSASYHHHLSDYVVERLPKDRHLRVLDNMTGTGYFIPVLLEHYDFVYAADLSEKAVRYAAAYSPNVMVADATALPYQNGSFELIFVRSAIHHIPQVDQVFSEIYRTLTPGGYCIILEPLDDNILIQMLRRLVYYTHRAFDPVEERGLTTQQLMQHIQDLDFKVIHREPYGLIGFALFCNPDTIPFTRPLSFIPGAAIVANSLARLDRWLLRLPLVGNLAFKAFIIIQKPTS